MNKTYRIAITGIFMALVLLLGLTPIGLIPLGFVNLTILHIPVIIGSILLGLKSGLALGACFGFASMMSLFGLSLAPQSALAYALLSENAFMAIFMCFVPRLLIPVVSYFTYHLIFIKSGKRVLAGAIAGVLGSLTNTIFYLGFMYLFYKQSGLDLDTLANGLGLAGLGFFGIVVAIATGGGGMEAIASGIITPSIVTAVSKTRFMKKINVQ